MKVNILGTEYTITECSEKENSLLENMDGYCDKTTKEIVIKAKPDDCNLGDFEVYRKKVMRHEIIHAFLFESGLHENFEHTQYGHNETMIDWVAVQYLKMLEAFKQVGCI